MRTDNAAYQEGPKDQEGDEEDLWQEEGDQGLLCLTEQGHDHRDAPSPEEETMNKKKQRRLQQIPGRGNGKGKTQPSNIITIAVIEGKVQVSGFPGDLRLALDILHEAAKAIINQYVGNVLKMRLQEDEAPKPREYMGARSN